jgi:hypothetical protein
MNHQFLTDHFWGFEVAAGLAAIVALLLIRRFGRGN